MTDPTISTILLVPADGDPHGLLADGPCGARPPVMVRDFCRLGGCGWTRWSAAGSVFCGECGNRTDKGRRERALVLAHRGEPVPEGCDRLDWVVHSARKRSSLRPARQHYEDVVWCFSPAVGVDWALSLSERAAGPGTIVLLDATGTDITADVLGTSKPTTGR